MDKYKMAQNHSINIKLSNAQLDELKLATKNEIGVTLRLWQNIGDVSNVTNFPHKSLLIDQ